MPRIEPEPAALARPVSCLLSPLLSTWPAYRASGCLHMLFLPPAFPSLPSLLLIHRIPEKRDVSQESSPGLSDESNPLVTGSVCGGVGGSRSQN